MAVGLANLTHWSGFRQADLTALAQHIGRFVNHGNQTTNCYVVIGPNVGWAPLTKGPNQARLALRFLENQLTDDANNTAIFPFTLGFDVRSAISAKIPLVHDGLLLCASQAGLGSCKRRQSRGLADGSIIFLVCAGLGNLACRRLVGCRGGAANNVVRFRVGPHGGRRGGRQRPPTQLQCRHGFVEVLFLAISAIGRPGKR